MAESRRQELVGVLGGTFDPVHLGHVGLARHVLERTDLARVLFMPAAAPPHKDARALTPAFHREAMLRLAIDRLARIEISRLELETGGLCYTVDSLRRLRRAVHPVFIMGLDSLVELHTWHEYAALIREFDLIVARRSLEQTLDPAENLEPRIAGALVPLPARLGPCREAWSRARPGGGGRIFLLETPPLPYSSSAIRARAARGLALDGLVPPAVARYIQRHRLYEQEGSR